MSSVVGIKGKSPMVYPVSPGAAGGSENQNYVASYTAGNDPDGVTVTTALTTLATIDGIAAEAGQKFIVHATVWYTSVVGNGTIFTAVYVTQPPGPDVVEDGAGDSVTVGQSRTVTRVFEIPVTSTGTYNVSLKSNTAGGATSALVLGTSSSPPAVSPSARLTVEVVNV